MKNKLIVLLTVFVFMLTVVAFVGCAEKQSHLAKSEWSFDENNHWHDCAESGHNDKFDFGAHRFGDVTTIQTGDDASSAKQLEICQDCGYEVYLQLDFSETIEVTPAVTVGDEADVKDRLVTLMKKRAESDAVQSFSYTEYVTDGDATKQLKSESLSFDKLTLDFDGIDTAEFGYKTIAISYNGVKRPFDILLVPDLKNVDNTEYSYLGNNDEIVRIYSNGYLALTNEFGLTVVSKWDSVDEENHIVALYINKHKKDLMVIDDEKGAINFFDAAMLGDEPEVYTIDSLGYFLNVYAKNGKSYSNIYAQNGKEFKYVDTVSVEYATENTIVVYGYGIFVIGEDDSLTPVGEENSYADRFVMGGKTYKVEFFKEFKAYYSNILLWTL